MGRLCRSQQQQGRRCCGRRTGTMPGWRWSMWEQAGEAGVWGWAHTSTCVEQSSRRFLWLVGLGRSMKVLVQLHMVLPYGLSFGKRRV
jgi:hypothetical protein